MYSSFHDAISFAHLSSDHKSDSDTRKLPVLLANGIVTFLFVLVIVALLALVLLPSPIKVETARVTRGPPGVTVDEEGEARAHDQ
ncbi:MAG: hypothetical protein AABN34_08440 [Acidobacteriota bacterium]